ncbi:hypothetical protein EVAR_7061_1 [Eumeta japonica]|uniref:Uncharacterized protein n=1 Tax=Eumeta variegata TaxID=151549 RepID=A0A4C1X8E3_EUMVA|nr:hypothetical protein EVAR_7061_1 [Eumeta japonica]
MTYFEEWINKNEEYLSVYNLALMSVPEKLCKVGDLNVNKDLSVRKRRKLQGVLTEYFDRFAFENSPLGKYSDFKEEIETQDERCTKQVQVSEFDGETLEMDFRLCIGTASEYHDSKRLASGPKATLSATQPPRLLDTRLLQLLTTWLQQLLTTRLPQLLAIRPWLLGFRLRAQPRRKLIARLESKSGVGSGWKARSIVIKEAIDV